jgi:hypothetical protein
MPWLNQVHTITFTNGAILEAAWYILVVFGIAVSFYDAWKKTRRWQEAKKGSAFYQYYQAKYRGIMAKPLIFGRSEEDFMAKRVIFGRFEEN